MASIGKIHRLHRINPYGDVDCQRGRVISSRAWRYTEEVTFYVKLGGQVGFKVEDEGEAVKPRAKNVGEK